MAWSLKGGPYDMTLVPVAFFPTPSALDIDDTTLHSSRNIIGLMPFLRLL